VSTQVSATEDADGHRWEFTFDGVPMRSIEAYTTAEAAGSRGSIVLRGLRLNQERMKDVDEARYSVSDL